MAGSNRGVLPALRRAAHAETGALHKNRQSDVRTVSEIASPQDTDRLAPRLEGRVRDVFNAEELDGLKMATRGRTIALGAVGLLLLLVSPWPQVIYYYALLAVFLVIGLLHYALAKSPYSRGWCAYMFATLDFALLGFTLTYPNPFNDFAFSDQIALRGSSFIYYFLMLVVLAFSYRPRLMMWGGIVGAVTWVIGVTRIAMLDETNVVNVQQVAQNALVEAVTNPASVFVTARFHEVAVLIIVAWMLAMVVDRSRRMVLKQSKIERERANLARYFPPNIVDEIAHSDKPFASVRQQPVAVLFADIVGFTKRAEALGPIETIDLLRDFHQRLERVIFDHGGTLDKYLGDGIMATFGTPENGAQDAYNALACAHAILDTMAEWNRTLVAEGRDPIRISVGIHYGSVVIGDLGSERQLELAVLGDTVNVASRLERLTRDLGCQVVISDACHEAAREQANGNGRPLFDRLEPGPNQPIRGRESAVSIWTLAA